MASLSDILKNTAESASSAARIGAQKAYGRVKDEVMSGLRPTEDYQIDPESISDEEVQEQVIKANRIKRVQQSIQTVSSYYNKAKTAVAVGEFLVASWPIILVLVIGCSVVYMISNALSIAPSLNVTNKVITDTPAAVQYTSMCNAIMYAAPGTTNYPKLDSLSACFTYLDCLKGQERVGGDEQTCNPKNLAIDDGSTEVTPGSKVASEVGVPQDRIQNACDNMSQPEFDQKYKSEAECLVEITCQEVEDQNGETYSQCK